MTSRSVELRPWGWRRWWGLVALIFVVQLGLIFWLGSRVPIRALPPAAGLTLHLGGQTPRELQTLNDPTLFTLPHPQGFSGPVWGKVPLPGFRPFEWTAPPSHLPLTIDRMGAAWTPLQETNQFRPLPLPPQLQVAPTLPAVAPVAGPPNESMLLLEGGLAQRRLRTKLPLKPWSGSEILNDSVVQVLVDADGLTISPTLLSGSGSPEADRYALEQARAARFEPLGSKPGDGGVHSTSRLTWGRMIFRWHTVATPPSNAAAATP